jgi:hypothetical protein
VPLGCLTILSLLAFPGVRPVEALTAGLCGSAVVLQIGYIPAIMAHYRIFFGKQRRAHHVDRVAGEPAERVFVLLTVAIAVFAFMFIFCQQRLS